ncbi:hypothetical protein BUALT_Bualt02G0055500 [Buddleja alternifolia]|uniref:Uncharacterized protein n=1 Tax=Buddleja alternifolia TaxID=168488 RepID=A0AAV6Y691_9LAMI|nr:hypothetical protein BUALT_Bualt02G0055500 [Buddleja alternifolia]
MHSNVDQDYPLHLIKRVAYGANETVRHDLRGLIYLDNLNQFLFMTSSYFYLMAYTSTTKVDNLNLSVLNIGFECLLHLKYVDDPYDRIWTHVVGGNGLSNVASDAILIDTSESDHPSSKVLRNAITASSPSAQIQLLHRIFLC